MTRPTWDETFMAIAETMSLRSTCLARQVGAVIVKDRQIISTGYNGSPPGTSHCTEQGYCYPGLEKCGAGSTLPSRAIHAEQNAIAQAAKRGVSTDGAIIYVTLEPCLSCVKSIISAGIREVVYRDLFYSWNHPEFDLIADWKQQGLIDYRRIGE